MKKDDLTSALTKVLFNDWSPEPSKKAAIIISLCGYYGVEAMPETIQAELGKLNSQQPMLFALETLLKAIEGGRSNDFRWDPHFHPEHTPEHLTMNPTFNVQRGDDATIVAEIKEIREKLNDKPVNITLLISYIAKMARESGDLSFEQNG